MKNRGRGNLDAIIAASKYNNAFRSIYREFENSIFFKINNKEPVHESLSELVASGCMPKPSHFFSATCYMRIELTMEHVNELRDTMFSQLYPVIRNLNSEQMNLMLRSILEAISKQILQMDLITFEDLMNIDFRNILLSSSKFLHAVQDNPENIELLLRKLPEAREKFMHEYESYINEMVSSRFALWRLKDFKNEEYEREIENEFVLSSIKLN